MTAPPPLLRLPDGRAVWIMPLFFGRARLQIEELVVGRLTGGIADEW